MKKFLILAALCFSLPGAAAMAQTVAPPNADVAIKSAFPQAPADWAGRLDQDETLKVCSATRNHPSAAQSSAITARETASIKYPADNELIGDWKKGENLAQNGYGMRFTDYPATRPTGGNCYACHQMTPAEVSYGTIGPSLYAYGKSRKYSAADAKAVYEKIYNAHAAYPCSLMPRFGANGVLTIDQIKDLVALVMSPDSPVNK